MSLRDFNLPSSDDPTALHHVPGGNETGLESFHTIQPQDVEPNNTPKIVGAIAVALMVGAAGVALYASQGSSSHSKQMVAAAAPAATAPVTPPPAAAPIPETPASPPGWPQEPASPGTAGPGPPPRAGFFTDGGRASAAALLNQLTGQCDEPQGVPVMEMVDARL